jgi:hypothetical protein
MAMGSPKGRDWEVLMPLHAKTDDVADDIHQEGKVDTRLQGGPCKVTEGCMGKTGID